MYEGVKVFTCTDSVIAKASPASHSHSCSHVSTGHNARGDNVVLHCQISPRTGGGRGLQGMAGNGRGLQELHNVVANKRLRLVPFSLLKKQTNCNSMSLQF